MTSRTSIRDHYLPADRDAFRRGEPSSGRIIVIAPTRAACETIELALQLRQSTVLEREHGDEIRDLASRGLGFGIVAGTGTGKTLGIRMIAEEIVGTPLRVGVVNREREATPETPTWNVVIVTTGIARRWFQGEFIERRDTIIVDEIHQTSAELELCLALGKRVGCRFIWLSATVDPSFYADYLDASDVLETSAFDPNLAATVRTHRVEPLDFLGPDFIRRVLRERRGVAIFVPTRAEVERVAAEVGRRWSGLTTAFYHGGQPIRVIRPFLEGAAAAPFLLALTAAGQSALNIQGLDTVVIHDAQFANVIQRGRNVLTRRYLGDNELLQMAGRVHGRVEGGEVHILTDRDLEFSALRPTPPEFQLAGDTERIALTAAALAIDLEQLELPVPLDRRTYGACVRRLSERGIVHEGRLTAYGRNVEAMPVDRPWGELLVLADEELIPYLAAMSSIESLYRMTRDEHDLSGLIVRESDHLTAYNVFAEAVNLHAEIGEVYGLPRHLFRETLREWADERGVLVKVLEDTALGFASVYRTLEMRLPARLSLVSSSTARRFRELVAEVMPFEIVLDEHLANGDRARVARGSLCGRWGAVAGTVRYFADRFGTSRAAIEGTSLSLALIKRFAKRAAPTFEYRRERRHEGLFVVYRTEYFGFELDRVREPLVGPFPDELAGEARAALATALASGVTSHRDQSRLRTALDRLGEYWRRSGGTLTSADPRRTQQTLTDLLADVGDMDAFYATRVALDVDALVPPDERQPLDELPRSVRLFGDRVPLDYEIDDGEGVVRVRLREGQARRIESGDLPDLPRPARFTVVRGGKPAIRAGSIDELKALVAALPRKSARRKFRGPRRPKRRR